jgi:hypothetical protein
MGQCYAVYMKYKFKDENGLVKALNSFIKGHDNKDCRFNLDLWENGFDLTKFGNLMRVFFSNTGSENQVTWGVHMKAPKGMTEEDCKKQGIPHWTEHECVKNNKTGKYETVDVLWVTLKTDADGFNAFNSGFDASYSWEMVMEQAFGVMAQYLVDGSELNIDMDEGSRELVVKNGNVEEN